MDTRIFPITMPKWGIEMQQGTVTGWHISVGKSVNKGDHLLDVETEKIVNSVEAPVNGTLRLILADTGATENVGALIGVFADESVSASELQQFVRTFKPANASFEGDDAPYDPAATPAPQAPASTEPAEGEGKVSPIARRIAERLGVDITKVKGTGRGGRVSKEDVEAYAAAQGTRGAVQPVESASAPVRVPAATGTSAAPASGPIRVKLSSMRAAIAKRLLESSQSIPHYRVAVDVPCGALAAHAAANRATGGGSINDLIVRACALALREHPSLNSHLVGDEIITYPTADISIAVATENGLITPVVRAAESKTSGEIGGEIKSLAERARSGSLTREEISGGTFTISNLGMFGIDRFDAIINPPQVAILAVAAISERVIVDQGKPAVAKVVTLTLSADHRVIDGAAAARFLATLKSLIQSPASL